MDSKSAPRYFRNFYARRVLRIFPLYYGMLVALTIVAIWKPNVFLPHQQPWMWTYTSNIYEAIYRKFGFYTRHFWSLAVEEQFYFLWPVVVYRCHRRSLLWICGAAIAFASSLR